MTKEQTIKELTVIPGIGKSLATDLWNIGITSIDDLKGKDPEVLFTLSNDYARVVQDRCVLYAFRCAIYFAQTPPEHREEEKLNWVVLERLKKQTSYSYKYDVIFCWK